MKSVNNICPHSCPFMPVRLRDFKSRVGKLPVQCAAMNMTNINVQLMTIEAARTRKKEDIYRAAMLDPHTAGELSMDEIVAMCDELIEAHGEYMEMYH